LKSLDPGQHHVSVEQQHDLLICQAVTKVDLHNVKSENELGAIK
jgi:hypothetical protein